MGIAGQAVQAPTRLGSRHTALVAVLVLLTAAGLAIDAYVHIDRAPIEPPPGSGQISETTLFYLEAAVAIAAAALLVVFHRRWSFLIALLVAGTAFAAIMITRYVDLGAIGPIPNLSEPAWYPQKVLAAVAEAVATLTALLGALLARPTRRHRRAAAVDRARASSGA